MNIPTGNEHYQIRVTRLTVAPPDEPIFSECATDITIVDEAAGEFLEIQQHSIKTDAGNQMIRICTQEWPALREAIDYLMQQCRDDV